MSLFAEVKVYLIWACTALWVPSLAVYTWVTFGVVLASFGFLPREHKPLQAVKVNV